MKAHFDLYKDTTDLRETLESTTWELFDEDYESTSYTCELDGKTYYKVDYFTSVVITDDPAIAFPDSDSF